MRSAVLAILLSACASVPTPRPGRAVSADLWCSSASSLAGGAVFCTAREWLCDWARGQARQKRGVFNVTDCAATRVTMTGVGHGQEQ